MILQISLGGLAYFVMGSQLAKKKQSAQFGCILIKISGQHAARSPNFTSLDLNTTG